MVFVHPVIRAIGQGNPSVPMCVTELPYPNSVFVRNAIDFRQILSEKFPSRHLTVEETGRALRWQRCRQEGDDGWAKKNRARKRGF
jgi:hypothetical protein